MTVIETTVQGEVVELLDADAARDLLDCIQINLDDTADLIDQLWRGRGWIALDYGSWDALVAEQIRGRLPKLEQAERIAAVGKLSASGMSNRAIADALDINRRTVARDQVEHSAPRESVEGKDGKTYSRPKSKAATPEELEDTARRQRQTRIFQHAEDIYALLGRLTEEGVDDLVKETLIGINNLITQSLKGEA